MAKARTPLCIFCNRTIVVLRVERTVLFVKLKSRVRVPEVACLGDRTSDRIITLAVPPRSEAPHPWLTDLARGTVGWGVF